MRPQILSIEQKKTLNRIGDLLIPGDEKLPSFSKANLTHHSWRMTQFMSPDDFKGFGTLLHLFRFCPNVFIRGILSLASNHKNLPDFLATPFRLINLGIKGVVMTLYYTDLSADKKIHREIKWDTHIDLPKGEPSMETQSFQKGEMQVETTNANETMKMARDGFHSISNTPIENRIECIKLLREIIIDQKEKIIDAIQKETKKSRSDALISEIYSTLDTLHFLEANGKKILKDETVSTPVALLGKKSQIFYDPLGVILVISPWNYPFFQAIAPIASAVMCGNSVIYKPSEFTPLKGLIEELLKASGFQENWVQVIYGDGKLGAELIDEKPEKIFFTGSVSTGKKIMQQAASHLIPVVLELGGKDPMIVFEDVNIERAAAGAAWGGLTNVGQACTSVEKILVQKSIYEKFKNELISQIKLIRQKTDSDGDAEIGEITTPAQTNVIFDHIQDAKEKGARIHCESTWDGRSSAIPPMVIDNVNQAMKIWNEETFGPTLPLVPFDDEEHAIELANDSNYGLSASVWSKDIERASRVAHALETGNVSINNVMLTEGNPNLPFGGVKTSGIGRTKGAQGLREFCNVKSILIDQDSNKMEANWYPYTNKRYQLFSKMTELLFKGGPINFIKFAITGLKLENYSNQVNRDMKDR